MKCKKCKDTGLLPFIKDGTVSKYAKIFCDCHPIYGIDAHYGIPIATEGKRPPTRGTIPRGRVHLYIDDFDFPMSYSFSRSLCQLHGWNDPGSCELPESKEPIEIKQETEWTKKQWDAVQQLKGLTLHLQERMNSHLDKKKKGRYLD